MKKIGEKSLIVIHLCYDTVGFAPLEVVRDFDAQDLEIGLPQVAQARVLLAEVSLMFDSQCLASEQHRRQLGVVVGIHASLQVFVGEASVCSPAVRRLTVGTARGAE